MIDMNDIHFLIIGDSRGRRIKSFVDCVRSLDFHNITVLSWRDIIHDISLVEKYLVDNTILKIEPGEKDMEIYRQFLIKGREKNIIGIDEIKSLDFTHYPIVAPAQWYMGFSVALKQLEKVINQSDNNLFSMNHFTEVIEMMDKSRTYNILKKDVENQRYFLPEKLEHVDSYEALQDYYANKHLKCFIKLRYGSGSTGVLAYCNNPKLCQERVYTSLNYKCIEGKRQYFSNYKVHCYKGKEEIRNLIDWVFANGAHMEKWIPKSSYDGLAYDTRSFVINKKSHYLLSRLSKSPITNLHLRNLRRESHEILSKEELQLIAAASEDVMKVFGNSLYAGIDVITLRNNKPYIIDVNPFGDLYHHLLGKKENIYYYEIKKAIEELRKSC